MRKTSQAALLLLLEQEVIERRKYCFPCITFSNFLENVMEFFCVLVDVERQICPVLIELCSIDSTDDFRTEAVTVSVKMKFLLFFSFHFFLSTLVGGIACIFSLFLLHLHYHPQPSLIHTVFILFSLAFHLSI